MTCIGFLYTQNEDLLYSSKLVTLVKPLIFWVSAQENRKFSPDLFSIYPFISWILFFSLLIWFPKHVIFNKMILPKQLEKPYPHMQLTLFHCSDLLIPLYFLHHFAFSM